MYRRIVTIALLTAALGLAAAAQAECGDAEAHATENPEDKIVSIEEGMFVPDTLRIVEGGTVTWINRDEYGHEVTSGMPGDTDDAFASDRIFNGERFVHTFEESGVYHYHCALFADMQGVVIVETAEEHYE
jgi:plastocyanin